MGKANGVMAGKSPLVLIVEDERDIADMLADYFGIEGYRTLVAGDAASAVEACRRGPDIVLLDVNLPDGDGFEVCAKVRGAVACPIVFFIARVEDADAIAGFAAGGDDSVTKPFSLEVLGARVRRTSPAASARRIAPSWAFRTGSRSTSAAARRVSTGGWSISPARTSTSSRCSPNGLARCSTAT